MMRNNEVTFFCNRFCNHGFRYIEIYKYSRTNDITVTYNQAGIVIRFSKCGRCPGIQERGDAGDVKVSDSSKDGDK